MTLKLSAMPLLLVPLLPLSFPVLARAQSIRVNPATQISVVTQSDEALYFNADTMYELPLKVQSSVIVNDRTLPAGTIIQGRLEPVTGGLRYVATAVKAGGLRQSLSATSIVLTDIKDPRETSAEAIAGDAAIGAAGGAVVGAIIGDGISLLEVLGGAAAGVVVGNVTAQRVVVIEPDEAIVLQVQ